MPGLPIARFSNSVPRPRDSQVRHLQHHGQTSEFQAANTTAAAPSANKAMLILSGFYPGIKALRDVTSEQLAAHADVLSPRDLQTLPATSSKENVRVLETVESFRRRTTWPASGQPDVLDSHRSLRDPLRGELPLSWT